MQPFFRELESDPAFVSEQARYLADRWVRRGLRPTAEQRDFIQRVLLSGLDCCPGQQDLFPTDGDQTDEQET